jgi:hypothetical protein
MASKTKKKKSGTGDGGAEIRHSDGHRRPFAIRKAKKKAKKKS